MSQIREGSPPSPEPPKIAESGIRVAKGEMATFLAWERLRVFYNAILAAVVLQFALGGGGWSVIFWWNVVFGALIANVCYCAGPVLENYARVLGCDEPLVRTLLFVVGTLSALALTIACLLTGFFAPLLIEWP